MVVQRYYRRTTVCNYPWGLFVKLNDRPMKMVTNTRISHRLRNTCTSGSSSAFVHMQNLMKILPTCCALQILHIADDLLCIVLGQEDRLTISQRVESTFIFLWVSRDALECGQKTDIPFLTRELNSYYRSFVMCSALRSECAPARHFLNFLSRELLVA